MASRRLRTVVVGLALTVAANIGSAESDEACKSAFESSDLSTTCQPTGQGIYYEGYEDRHYCWLNLSCQRDDPSLPNVIHGDDYPFWAVPDLCTIDGSIYITECP